MKAHGRQLNQNKQKKGILKKKNMGIIKKATRNWETGQGVFIVPSRQKYTSIATSGHLRTRDGLLAKPTPTRAFSSRQSCMLCRCCPKKRTIHTPVNVYTYIDICIYWYIYILRSRYISAFFCFWHTAAVHAAAPPTAGVITDLFWPPEEQRPVANVVSFFVVGRALQPLLCTSRPTRNYLTLRYEPWQKRGHNIIKIVQ